MSYRCENRSKRCQTYPLRAYLAQKLPKQISRVLVACHTGGNLVGVGHVAPELYLETVVVETFWLLVGKAREFKVVRGYHACHTALGYVLKEETRASELVGRVGALEYLVQYDESVAVDGTEGNQTLQPEQLGIEIAYL